MARTNLIRHLPGRREPALKLSMLAACSVLALSAPAAVANPQGGEVAAGQATISNPNATTTQINQQSDKAVVNWSSFNIGENESTVFVQPNASSITLNRIFDANPSVIAGLLTANGRLILVNRNGMMFDGSAKIDTAGLVASTADISDENFLAGRYNFNIAGNPGAKISNAGSIVVKPQGVVAIVAPTVENTGLISAKLGRIGVGAGSTFILDIQGENLVGFPISAEVAQHLIGPDGELVDTQVLVPARAARALVEDMMKPSGYTIATDAQQTADGVRFTGATNGSWLSVQNATGGSVALGGTLDVSGARAGSVAVTGDTVMATGTIRANGTLGGSVNIAAKNLLTAGRIDADGAYLGGGVTLNASNRQIATSSAIVSANGGLKGGSIALSGGESAGQGLFTSGTYTATSSAGIGGAVTVNGHDLKLIDAKVDVSGATGGGRITVGYSGDGASRVVGTDTLLVSPTSTFKADATKAGNGGSVVFWSNLSSDFMGTLTAKGGALSGNGGFLEVSSKGEVGFWGLGDASAANGLAGTLSLDPKNIIISNVGSTFPSYQLIDPSASAGNLFGGSVAVLSTGNTVVTSAQDDFAAANAGAVHVYNTLTGALVSTLTGSTANNLVGSGGITVLTNGNFVVASPNWDNGAATDAGAATWVSGTTGLSGSVALANSYVGTASNNQVSSSGIVALTNGNYVVRSPNWDNGGTNNVGAVTWGNGLTGSTGAVGAANSLIGGSTDDQVGGSAVIALSNGNYVVNSQLWNNGGSTDAGAVTWGDGTNGRYGPSAVFGAVSAANSFVGSSSNDRIGEDGLIGLTNGNFVFASSGWNNGGTINAGAVTWGNGTTGAGAAGTLSSASNSLIGGASNADVGSGGVVALSNGNYVAISPDWDNGGGGGQGAVTWGNGTTGTFGTVAAANSVIGASSGDNVGSGGVRALTNGNFVIASPNFDAGVGSAHGAVTWRNGAAASNVTVGLANSLLGVTSGDNIGSGGIVALSNGNYVVVSPNWDNGGTSNVGAVTWGNGTTGTTGQVTSLISTIGATSGDTVGSGGVFALTNGNYVIASPNFDTNGGAAGNAQGAVTWRDGTAASSGAVGAGNSLTGSTSGDNVGSGGIVALTNGNYVVRSQNWDNGAATNAGAVTWASGTAATSASVSAANSLVGSTTSDQIGSGGVTALSTGDYIVASPLWNNGATADAGVVTLGVGTGGTVGAITATNSIAATTANAQLTYAGTSGANEYAARSSAAGQVFVGITSPAQVTFARAQGQTLTVNPAFITRTLNTGTAVTLQASNDITLVSDLLVNNVSGNGGALTLLAGRSVLLNANITTDNGNLTIVANDLLSSGVIDAQRDPGSAVLAMASGTTINAGTGDVRLTIASGAGKTQTASGALTLSNVIAGTLIAENLGPSNGDVVINAASALTASGSGTPLVLAAQGGNFVNNAGAGALSTPSGRWIVYSQTPTANTNGGLAGSPFYDTAYNSANPTGLSATGNRFAYTVAPVLTVAADSLSREYGDANPALTYAISGFIGGDNPVLALSGAPSLATAATPTSSVSGGPYAITTAIGSLASDYNYGFSLVDGQLTINPATLTYLADPQSRLYGAANPALAGSISGFKNGEDINSATTGAMTFTTAATTTSNVGSYAINGGGLTALNGNYVFAQDASNATALTINPATLTYIADPAARLYGAANPTLTGTVTGFQNGEDINTATTGALAFTSPAIATSNVGSYAINGSGLTANNGNYVFVQDASNATALTINPATLTYIADPQSRLYGDANPALTGTVTGFQNGEDINTATTGALTFATAATPTSNVGNYAIDGSGLTANNGNYVFVQDAGNATALTINPATLTYLADPKSRLYGDANPALTGSISGFKNGEDINTATTGTMVFTTAVTATSNVGSYAIDGGGLTALNGNYVFAQDASNATALTINPSTLTYVADPAARLYGAANPAFTGSVTGFKNGEDINTATTGALTFASLATPTSNVGTYAIDGSGLTANNGNYVFVQSAGNATALTINPATLTYIADPQSRLYGGANPALTGTVTGFQNGEDINTATTGVLAFTTAATATSNVGSYAINGSGLTANNGNYVFVQDASNATALTINPATLTYIADPKTRLYGDANPALTGTVTGFQNGEDINTATTGALAFTTAATQTSNVGSYAINGSGLIANNGNYVFVQDAANATALTIDPSTLTYVADPKSRLYGDANPAFTGVVTGFKNGEDANTATTGALTFASSATPTSNVGSYAIDGSGLTANNGNYVFTQAAANATALTINPATLTYLADPASHLYGAANPALTGSISGFKNGEDINTATTGAMTFTTAATVTSNVGSYAIDGGGLTALNGNYVFAQDASNATALTINPATLTYIADPAARLYGAANPTFTGNVTGFQNGETIATATSGALAFTSPATATSNVGSYAINGSGLTANNGNYVFVQDASNATALTINPATLTYVADPKTRLYGDANPALTGTVTGFQNGETVASATTGSLTFATAATAASNVGSYAIDGSGLTANNGNYVFVQDAGNATAFTINPATLTYIADPASRLYGDANPAFTGTVAGFKNGDTQGTATTGVLTFGSTAAATSNVGTYAINGSGLTATSANYVFAQDPGNAAALTINPATLTYTADPASRLYGDANPAFTGAVSGFKNGETVATATTGTLTFTSPATATSAVGTHAIDGGGLTANNGNYVFAQASGNATALTINPATLTYLADPKSRLYGDANPALTGTVTGFKNGETIATATTGALAFATTATTASNVGSYAITGSGLTAANYVFVQDPSNATALAINPATLTYVADPQSRLYGDANPALTGSVTGFKNGETIATATTGALAFTTAATATANVGAYAVNGSGLTANNGNYVFVQGVGNATALIIKPATLTYVADPATRLYSQPNPVFTGSVTGFKNGETIATATTGALAFTSPANIVSLPGSYAINGGGLTAVNGNYVFAQSPTNATALTIDVNPSVTTLDLTPTRLQGQSGEGASDEDTAATAANDDDPMQTGPARRCMQAAAAGTTNLKDCEQHRAAN
ncbi:MAG: filamentous hemagglutinin N-terminal domain-containing protein [Alphaproteobacteria bacterium]|nr:filamentous hemagglutinin N-terminal domain-containing protein [Alphaproteobacteria bacterium]